MLNVLLLGGTGFIGQAIAKSLLTVDSSCRVCIAGRDCDSVAVDLAANPRIVVKEEEFDSQTDFERLVAAYDIVVHLFSSSVPISSGVDCFVELQDIPITSRLLDACVAAAVHKFVFVSSAGSVYGDVDEKTVSEESACEPVSLYAYQKKAIEDLVGFYGRTKGLNYCIVRLSNPYGPGQNPMKPQGVIPVFLMKAMNGMPLTVRGDGEALRDYIYIDDAADAICALVLNDTMHRVYNVGSGTSVSIRQVVDAISAVVDDDVVIERVPKSAKDVKDVRIDVGRYEHEFGELGKTSLMRGIEETKKFLERRRDGFDARCE